MCLVHDRWINISLVEVSQLQDIMWDPYDQQNKIISNFYFGKHEYEFSMHNEQK